MSTKTKTTPKRGPGRPGSGHPGPGRPPGVSGRYRAAGDGIIWPKGIEARYDISKTTRWLWEQSGKLPPRDVYIGGSGEPLGWKPSTIEAMERGEMVPRKAPTRAA